MRKFRGLFTTFDGADKILTLYTNVAAYYIRNNSIEKIPDSTIGGAFGINEDNAGAISGSIGEDYLLVSRNRPTILYTFNTLSPSIVADQLNTSDGFGVDEYVPSGITNLNNVNYMVGQSNARLYRLSVETPKFVRKYRFSESQLQGDYGTPVINFDNTPITDPVSITSNGTDLFVLDNGSNAIYSVRVDNGSITRISGDNFRDDEIGDVSDFVIFEGKMYLVARVGDLFTKIYVLDLNGNSTGTSFFIDSRFANINAIGSYNGSLYISDTRNGLFRLDVITGEMSLVTNQLGFGVGESRMVGLHGISDNFFGIGADTTNLYLLSGPMFNATKLGVAERFGIGENIPKSLTSIGQDLYMLGLRSNSIIRLSNVLPDRTTKFLLREMSLMNAHDFKVNWNAAGSTANPYSTANATFTSEWSRNRRIQP